MRRSIITLAVISLLMGLMATPAAAGEPEVSTDQEVIKDYNPCTGEVMTVTINLLIWVYEGEDEFIVRVRRTGTTSDGYIMEHGREDFVASGGTETGGFHDPWHNPETGDSFVAQARFYAIDGDVLVDEFRLVCRTGPTILP